MKWRLIAATMALSISGVGLLGFGMTRDPGEIPSPLPSRAAPTFALRAFTSDDAASALGGVAFGDTISLAAMRGDVVVVNFWASWCLACRDEHDALARVGGRFAGTDVHFVGILYNDSPRAATRWLAKMGALPYPSLHDPGARTAIDYGLYGVPETFFIDRDGRVAYKHFGAVTEAVLLTHIAALRAKPRGDAQ